MIDPNEAPEGHIAESEVDGCAHCALSLENTGSFETCGSQRISCFYDERKDGCDVIFKKKPIQGMTQQDIDEKLSESLSEGES